MNRIDTRPPRLARKLLRRFCAPQWLEEIEGDLEEQYATQAHNDGVRRAQLTYWRDALLYVGHAYIRQHRLSYQQAHGPIMLANYLKIALRNLKRHQWYAFINVMGLAVGIACCLLIFLFVQREVSYDRFHEKADRIYRVYNDVRMPSGPTASFNVSAYVGPAMTRAFPEIEAFVRLAQPRASSVFAYQGQYYEETSLLYADSTIFDVFDFPLLRGNPATALAAPFSLVLTETTARKYFGDADPLGTVLTPSGEAQAFTVTGILADVPAASHLQFDGLISMATAEKTNTFFFQDLLDLRYATYLLLQDNASASALSLKFPDFVERTIGEAQRRSNVFSSFGLVSLPAVYLHAAHRGLGQSGSRADLYTFSAIALLTLLIACINFMNLATARSTKRAKEVGVRKMMGAQRRQLAGQFLGESILLSLGALILGIGLTALSLPLFNRLAGTALPLTTLAQPAFLLALPGIALGVGVIAGSYPALVLSSFRPAKILKGQLLASLKGTVLRKGLVVFQFAISVILLVGTGIVYQQLRHMQQQNLGFRTEQMLVIDFRADEQVQQQLDVIKQALTQIPGVVAATASQAIPSRLGYTALAYVGAAEGETREVMMPVFPVDHDFLDVYDLTLIAGRNFSPAFATDSTEAFLINETASRAFGFATPEDALGMSLQEWGQQGQVIGVVSDFHYTSLRRAIEPMNFLLGDSIARFLTVRIATDDLSPTVTAIETVWQRLAPHRPFDYRFLDASFDAQYRAEQRFGQIAGTFTGLAILVACLGLFGLATFMAEQRTKEIGIRKVLGATLPQLLILLSREFAVLVVFAVAVATPIAYTLMNRWLEAFAYRIEIPWQTFLIAGLTALGIALATVSYQSIKAALADPVKALRYE